MEKTAPKQNADQKTEQDGSHTQKRSWLRKLIDGYAWASTNTALLIVLFLCYVLLMAMIGWHTNQAFCRLTGVRHLYGVPFLIIGILGILTLFHEADYAWKYKWSKLPIGIASVFFIYYCMIDPLWWIAETVFCLTAEVSAGGTLLSGIASAVLVVIGYWKTKHIRTVSYPIPLGQAGKMFRIALISDLHLGAFVGVEHVHRVVAAVNDLQADLIVIAGDILDDDNAVLSDPDELNRISCALGQLKSKFGTVLTLGNHDPDAQDPAFCAFLDRCDIKLLHNERLELPVVCVIGLSDPTRNKRTSIGALLAERDPAKPLIVVDHDPRYMDAAVERNVDLVLSGHTHAGQFFPASVLTRAALGKQRFYGHHITGKTHTVITSGAGFFNLPVRIGTANEIVELRIGL